MRHTTSLWEASMGQEGDRLWPPPILKSCDLDALRMDDRNFHSPGSQFQDNVEKPFKVITSFMRQRASRLTVSSSTSRSAGNPNFAAAQKLSFDDRFSFVGRAT